MKFAGQGQRAHQRAWHEMLLEAILAKPDVESVRVVEIDADVIALVGPHFAADPRVQIIHAFFKGARFDFV